MKTRNLLQIIILIWALTVTNLQAQELSNIPGAFVDIGMGARPLGMGGAFVALANDVHAVLWNPAGLGQLERPEAAFSFAYQFGLVPYSFAAFSSRIANVVQHGEALLISGDAALKEVTLVIAFASVNYVLLPNLRLGGSLHIRSATFGSNDSEFEGQVTGSAEGFGIHFGVMYHISESITSGLILNNFMNFLKWNSSASGNYSQNLPRELTLGFAFKKARNFAFVFDYNLALNIDTEDVLHVGIEKYFFLNFVLRSGLTQNMDVIAGPNYTVGTGFYYRFPESFDFIFDASYLFNEIGNTFRASMGFRF